MAFSPRMSLLGVLLLLSAWRVQAERKTVAFGLLGGLNGTSYWGKDIGEFDINMWPTTGFTFTLHLPAFLGLEADILYSSKSGSFRTYPDGNLKVNTIKDHSLEMPLLVKVTAPTENEVQPFFFGGPSVAYLFSKETYSVILNTGGGLVLPEDAAPPIPTGNMVDYELSLALGGGVEWGLGSFQMRFNFGGQSLDKTHQADVRTFVVAVMAGFIF